MKSNNIHERLVGHEAVEGSSDRSFGLVFTAVFVIIGLWPLVFRDGHVRIWALAVAVAFLVVSILRPGLLAPLNRVWFKFGMVLHRIVNPVIMGLIFFVVITPIAIVMRLAGRDPLRLKKSESAASYWLERDPPGPEPKSMSDQF